MTIALFVMGCLFFLMGCVLFWFEVVRFVDERKEKREREQLEDYRKMFSKLKINGKYGKWVNEGIEKSNDEGENK